MGRSRVKKNSYQSWNPTILKQAIEAVKDRGMALRKASKIYGIPKTTLKRKIDEVERSSTDDFRNTCHKRTVFSPEQELAFKDLLMTMAETCHGFTAKDIRCLAFQFAERNGISHRFNRERGLAGADWFYGFKERHPEIPLKNAESITSVQPHISPDKSVLATFSETVEQTLKEGNFIAHRIFNSEQFSVTSLGSCVTSDRTDGCDIISRAVMCMSAGGTFIPPFVSIASDFSEPGFEERSPPGTHYHVCNVGWNEPTTLAAWFKHFLRYTKPSEDDPVLLFVGEESSVGKSADFLTKAIENHVRVLLIPSEKQQPLDIAFTGLLNRIFSFITENFQTKHAGQTLTRQTLVELFGEAYLQSSIPKTAISGFKVSGLLPFSPSLVTDLNADSCRDATAHAVKRKRERHSYEPSNGCSVQSSSPSSHSILEQHCPSGPSLPQLTFPFELSFDTL